MVMEVISHSKSYSPTSSSLNPNAPMFVPLAYRTVDDFSDEWWALVQSSPSFRDYWLQERFHDSQNDSDFLDIYDSSSFDVDALFHDDLFDDKNEEVEEEDYAKQLISLGGLKWRKGRALSESPRFVAKAPKIVNVKVSPRKIQQPR